MDGDVESIVPNGFRSTAHSIFLNRQIHQSDAQSNSNPIRRKRQLNSLDCLFESQSKSKIKLDHVEAEKLCECVICLQPFSDPVSLIMCDHFFCFECIMEWYKIQKACPLCKEHDASFVRRSVDGASFHLWRLVDDGEEDCDHKYEELRGKHSALVRHAIDQHRLRFPFSNDGNKCSSSTM